jgi:glycosyltransferase involved in cell wall biosynthesis
MRIFQVITVSEYGGAQTIVADLIERLSPEHELYVLYGGDGQAWDNLQGNFKKIKLNDHRKEVSIKDIGLLLKLFYYRLKYKPDIVHLHSSKMGVLGRLAFRKKRTVYTVHGFDSVRKAFRKFLIIEKFLKYKVFKIVGVSQYDVDMLKKESIYKNVVRIYNGVADHSSQKLIREKEKDAISRQLDEIKAKYPKILMCISRISKQKKFDLFIDIANQMPQHAFVWIGNKSKIDNLPSNVFCLGEVQFAYLYLRYADIFILPSNYEGLPISLLEALSYSVPAVASAVGGIGEVLDSKNGFAVENSVKSFEDKIEYIFSDKDIQNTMSAYARQTYLANFTIEKMIEGYKAIYKEIEVK